MLGINRLCSNRESCPLYYNWDTPRGCNVIKMVYVWLHGENVVEVYVPMLRMMLGESITNTRWAAMVLVAHGLYMTAFHLSKSYTNPNA